MNVLEQLNDMSDDDLKKLMEKVHKKQKNPKIIKNTMIEDFRKGNMRNLPCPVCDVKLKKCTCGLKDKLQNYKS